jgi:hypothetical protein
VTLSDGTCAHGPKLQLKCWRPKRSRTLSWEGFGVILEDENRHMLFVFIAHFFVIMPVDKFPTKKDRPLKTPIAKSPAPAEEYIGEAEKH